MRSDRAFLAAMLLLTLGAFLFRCIDLGNRPMHGDEAVHAEKFRELWEHGEYRYDSNEYHGPTIYYAALPSVILHGKRSWPDTREADYRLPIAVFGAAMLLLLLPLARDLGRIATLVAALFIAISPAFVLYSRYFIQEIPFIFFTLGMIACGWRYLQSRKRGWLILTGISAGLMIASKETSVLTLFALAVGAGSTALYTGWVNKRGSATTQEPHSDSPSSLTPADKNPIPGPFAIAIAGIIAILVAALLVSGFGRNLSGAVDYLRSYTPWFHRAQGSSIHNHPFFYYLQILIWTHRQHGGIWSELLIVALAVVGLITTFAGPQAKCAGGNVKLWTFIAFYTIVLTLVYSVIPYKTPWCLLSFLLGLCLLAGLGAVAIVDLLRPLTLKILMCIFISVAALQLAGQAYRASFVSYDDPNNPYVYAATVRDVINVPKRMDDLAKYWPQHKNMMIKVFSTSNYYWPIPWYLRQYPNVGYYPHSPQSKEEAAADVTLCDSALDDPMQALIGDTDLMNGYIEIRPGVFYEVFIRMDVWTTYLNGKNGGMVRKFVPPPEEK